MLTDNGTTLFDEPLVPPSGDSGWEQATPCIAVSPGGRPLVYLNGWAGAMTCCGIERVYYPQAPGTYASLDRDQGRDYPSEQVLGGEVVIMGYNSDWNSHFSCGACRGPIQIIRFQDFEYDDVTRQFPAKISEDASQIWASITPPYYNALIALAAWAADECEVESEAQAFSTIDSMEASGELSPPSGTSAGNFGYTLTGAAYVADLHGFLRQQGYCS